MCIFCVEVVERTQVFYTQARQLFHTAQDYPPRINYLTNSNVPEFLIDSTFDKMQGNPFEDAKIVILMADQMALELHMVKLGGAIPWLHNWQSLPLRWRQEMNEQFLLIDKLRAEGCWGVPNAAGEEMKAKYLKKLAEMKRRTFLL